MDSIDLRDIKSVREEIKRKRTILDKLNMDINTIKNAEERIIHLIGEENER